MRRDALFHAWPGALHCGAESTMTAIAWHLDRGIVLEDDGTLLPWGTPFAALRALGGPTELDRDTSLHLTWHDRLVLGGLRADVGACWIREDINPRAYHIYLPALHWVSVRLIEVHADPISAHRQLRGVHDHIVAAFGPATSSYPRYSKNLPVILWGRPPLQLNAGPQYGATNLAISISHTPTGYAEVRAEAARIRQREGQGAEVPHVAWHVPYDE